MKAKFVVCSRKKSRRIPNKPFQKINGIPIIEHLLNRLVKISSPVYLAIPPDDVSDYSYLNDIYGDKIQLFCHHADDPLKRMAECADHYGLDHIIRVTHDKIFIDPDTVYEAFNAYMSRSLDYLYSSEFTDGTAFEIISRDAVKKAADQFDKVEHISYAVKAVTDNQMDYRPQRDRHPARLLIDFPEDLTFFQTLLACIGNEKTLNEALAFIDNNRWIMNLNRLPLMTVYTCSYNNQDLIETAMESVANQQGFPSGSIEYLLIDDFSTDWTSLQMARFASSNSWARYFRNNENIGLASSSNRALSEARGKYIIRLDADDYFVKRDALSLMLAEFQLRDIDVLYSRFYDGSMHKIGDPKEHHHPAGALFKTRSLNHVRFTDKLRDYDGLDLYMRAKTQLKIGYLNCPTFFYRHRAGSLSRSNLEKRAILKKKIEGGSYDSI